MTCQRATGPGRWITQTTQEGEEKIISPGGCAWLPSKLTDYLQLGDQRGEDGRRWHNQPHRRDKRGSVLKTLTPSRGLCFPHLEMIVPMCHVNDALLTVDAATDLTQRTALQFLSRGPCSLSLMTLIMVLTCWWWMGLFPFQQAQEHSQKASASRCTTDFMTTVIRFVTWTRSSSKLASN